MQRLSSEETRTHLLANTSLLDMRSSAHFVLGFLPRAIHLPLGEHTRDWLSCLDFENKKVVLLTDKGSEVSSNRIPLPQPPSPQKNGGGKDRAVERTWREAWPSGSKTLRVCRFRRSWLPLLSN